MTYGHVSLAIELETKTCAVCVCVTYGMSLVRACTVTGQDKNVCRMRERERDEPLVIGLDASS